MTTPAQIAAAEIAFAHESVGRADDAGRLARFVVALWDQLGDQKMRRIAAEEELAACKCSNEPCPACGGKGPEGEWSEGSEVKCVDCGAELVVDSIETCLGRSSFSPANEQPKSEDADAE